MNPAPFFTEATQKRVTLGNFDDDFDKIKDVDWIIEVVVERMDIKQSVMARIEEHAERHRRDLDEHVRPPDQRDRRRPLG